MQLANLQAFSAESKNKSVITSLYKWGGGYSKLCLFKYRYGGCNVVCRINCRFGETYSDYKIILTII